MVKKRYMLTVAYDGTAYCGWQVQKNGLTVQEVLNRTLSELLGQEIRTEGASRTDAGVHALGNVAVFSASTTIPPERLKFALNAHLPEDIRIQASREVAWEFHPRFTSTVKTYEYRILNRFLADPSLRLNTLFCYDRLDADAMRRAAAYLAGVHDFSSFQGSGGTETVKTSVRTIFRAELDETFPYRGGLTGPDGQPALPDPEADPREEGRLLTIRLTGNGFLYNMVRIIAGTLLEIGRGRIPPEEMERILEARDREAAGPTAPARGLTLVSVRYPEWEPGFGSHFS